MAGRGGVNRTIDWQQDAKHYEFWVKGADDGTFEIPSVRPGNYTLPHSPTACSANLRKPM